MFVSERYKKLVLGKKLGEIAMLRRFLQLILIVITLAAIVELTLKVILKG